jgi:protein TonB
MTAIRTGALIAAVVFHLGLSAANIVTVPPPLLSGGGTSSPINYAISYQPIAIEDLTVSSALKSSPSIVKEIASPKPKEAKPAVEDVKAPLELKRAELQKPNTDESAVSELTALPVLPQKDSIGVHEVAVTEPVFAQAPQAPRYPKLARKRGQQGTVWVDIVLGANGDQLKAHVSQSSGVAQLDRAALSAVKQWQFMPHKINRIAVISRLRIPVEFSLDE